MNSPVLSGRRTGAFTLIELLTVIAIIAVLMSLLFPVAGMMKETARKTQAKNDVMGIVSAVKAYNTEYGKYPEVEEGADASADSMVGDKEKAKMKSNNSALFDTLRALDKRLNAGHTYNPRRVVFIEGKGVSKPEQPRAGFLDKAGQGGQSDAEGSYFDPWGVQYNVGIDRNYDNVVDLSDKYQDITTEDSPRTGVVAFALGRDNELGDKKQPGKLKESDDVASWQ